MAHSSDEGFLSGSEDNTEVYSYSNFISCANNLLNHCKDQASQIKILKRDNSILKEELDEIKSSQNGCSSLGKHDQAFHKLITSGIDRTKLASMIYGVGKHDKEGLGYEEGCTSSDDPLKVLQKSCSSSISQTVLSNHFVPAVSTMNLTEPIDQKLKGIVISEPDNSDVLISSVSNTSGSRAKAKGLNRRKPVKTNQKGPICLWVPKSQIVFAADIPKGTEGKPIVVPGQWLLTTYDRRKAYVPNPESERGRKCGIWRRPEGKDHRYMYRR